MANSLGHYNFLLSWIETPQKETLKESHWSTGKADKSTDIGKHVIEKKDVMSSNVNEVIKAILDFFIQSLHPHKKHETLTSKQK